MYSYESLSKALQGLGWTEDKMRRIGEQAVEDLEAERARQAAEFKQIPGAFAAFRAFRVGVNPNLAWEGEPVLQSLSGWSTKDGKMYNWDLERNEAHCGKLGRPDWILGVHKTGKANHDAEALVPVKGCTCGFWAYKTYEWLREERLDKFAPGEVVYALVAGWGKYVKAEYGVKTQFMRPLAIIEPHPTPLRPDAEYLLDGIELARVSLAAVPTIIESHGLTTIPPKDIPERQEVVYVNHNDESLHYSRLSSGGFNAKDMHWATGPLAGVLHPDVKDIVKKVGPS